MNQMQYFCPVTPPLLLETPAEIRKPIASNQLVKDYVLTEDERELLDGIRSCLLNIIRRWQRLIYSKETWRNCRIDKNAFINKGRLPFPEFLAFLMGDFVGCVEDELELMRFFTGIGKGLSDAGDLDSPYDYKIMDEGTLSKERNQISHVPFRDMFDITKQEYFKFKDQLGGSGGVYGVDGSVIQVPNLPFLAAFFGVSGKGDGSPSARATAIVDCGTDFVVEAALSPMRYGEAELFWSCVGRLDPSWTSEMEFVFDRGYASQEFMKNMQDKSVSFVVRLRSNAYGVKDLPESGGFDKELPNGTPIRMVRIPLPSGEVETLGSNIRSIPDDSYGKVYHDRWRSEVEYFFIKCKIRLGDFNGYTVNAVYQDFWVSMCFANVTTLVKMAANIIIQAQRRGKENKYKYEADMSEIISSYHASIVKALVIDKTEEQVMARIDRMIGRAVRGRRVVPVTRSYDYKESGKRNTPRRSHYHHNSKVH